MNPRIFLLLFLALSLPTHAEIYKWKDKDGVVRYSDVPPPSNIPRQSLKTNKAITSPAVGGEQPPAQAAPGQVTQPAQPQSRESEANKRQQEEAIKRQENAEKLKKQELDKQDKQANLERKQQNCITAKSNMEAYKQGGPTYKVNEKGEREYLNDEDFARGMQQAQKQIDENCQ